MLSAYIAVDVRSGPSIFHSDRKLPVGVVASTEPGDWHAIVELELRTPFVDSEAPLLRATVLRARRQATIVLTLHHALLDGLSAAVIVGDLLRETSHGKKRSHIGSRLAIKFSSLRKMVTYSGPTIFGQISAVAVPTCATADT